MIWARNINLRPQRNEWISSFIDSQSALLVKSPNFSCTVFISHLYMSKLFFISCYVYKFIYRFLDIIITNLKRTQSTCLSILYKISSRLIAYPNIMCIDLTMDFTKQAHENFSFSTTCITQYIESNGGQ